MARPFSHPEVKSLAVGESVTVLQALAAIVGITVESV